MRVRLTQILTLCALVLLIYGCQKPAYFGPGSSDITCINIIDRNGFSETHSNPDRIKRYANVDFLSPQPYQKVLQVYGRDENNDIKASITSYHENGQVKQYLEVMNNRAFGKYREWYSNGQLKMEANVISGSADLTLAAERTWLFEDLNSVWDEQGFLEAEILYSKGKLQGCSTYYHTNGNVWKIVPFDKDEIHGIFEVFLDNGDLLSTSEYCRGLKDGRSVRYWGNQTVSSTEYYSEGLLCDAEYFDECGDLVSQISYGNGYKVLFSKSDVSEMHEYKNGIQEGEVQLYSAQGRLFSTYHVKDGLKHGEEIEYYDPIIASCAKSPKISLNWYEGKIQGIVKTWYASGIQESQREMSSNKKSGLSTAWYKNGSLMMIEDYDMNNLVKGQYYKMGEKIPVSRVSMGNGTATLFDSESHYIKKVQYHNGKPED